MDEFKPGDTVRLKSGGPLMTVISLDSAPYARDGAPKDHVFCQWFPEKASKPESGSFPMTAVLVE